ncbi:MAG: serine/threonine protein kinase [Holophagales bacterium]|nr:serine/threonine protein kinase [Holophagales bacterium]
METEGWLRIKDLFNQALDLDPEARSAFLRELRDRDSSLADEVTSLLRSHEDTSTLFEQLPSSEELFDDERVDLDRFLGTTVGPYLLDGRIGKGGTSSVFLGIRTDGSGERLAVKLLAPKRSQDVSIERFFDERQILAHLNHPHIARLVDGGQTADGIHYLVMELVDGVPIDTYCDEARLDLRSRVGLIRRVCSAVHYAHRNLVVHRDLKPTNIRGTRAGTPKLLAFGIAKLLNPDFSPTAGRPRSSRAPMTPDIARPEQFLGEPVSTASDVYSLAVVLYHLVTGRSPYETEGPTLAELARLVVTDVPSAPSLRVKVRQEEEHGLDDWSFPETPKELARRLSGDLDAVLASALAKDPDERYASAEALAEDLRRFEHGLPVLVRGDAFTYVTRRWLRRHRGSVSAVGAALLLGAGALVWRADTPEPSRTITRESEEARDRGGEGVEPLEATGAPSADDAVAAEARAAELERRIAELDGEGDGERAMELARELLAIRESRAVASPAQPGPRRRLAEAHLILAELCRSLGQRDGATSSYLRAAELLEELLAGDPADRGLRRELIGVYQACARAHEAWGRAVNALDHFRRVLDLGRSLPDPSASEQVQQARAGLAVGRLESELATRAGEPERRRRLEMARHQLRHALALADELSRLGPLGEAGVDLLAEIQDVMAGVEQKLEGYG